MVVRPSPKVGWHFVKATPNRKSPAFAEALQDIAKRYKDADTIHWVLDNLNTHKKNENWLKRHPNVRFHFTPTHASWLNQVEIWFSILQRQSLTGASFTSVTRLKEHIDAFIASYNANAAPFAWTKAIVHQQRIKGRRISQL